MKKQPLLQKPLIGTSWKMNKTNNEAVQYIERLQERMENKSDATVFILPPLTAVSDVGRLLQKSNSKIIYGAQNVHWDDAGAFTGEVSAPMLKELGCHFVEINHQERRKFFNETDETANLKIKAVLKHKMSPIICLGDEKHKDWLMTEAFLQYQLYNLLDEVNSEEAAGLILAYEPRWAIGMVEAASPSHVDKVHTLLRRLLSEKYDDTIAECIPLLYGGSVTKKNAAELIQLKDVDGLFIGRAALDPDGLADIVEIALKIIK
jgi:triosephosphate isomerase